MKVHMEKRIAVLVMAVVLLFCSCSFVYADEEERNNGEFKYKIKGNGTAIITGYAKRLRGDIYIPQLIDGYTVTEIGAYAFSDEENREDPKKLKKGMWTDRLFIPNTVTVIGEMAFYGSMIQRCDIPASVKYIGSGAFGGSDIKEHYVDKENETFATIDGILYNKKTKELVSCPVDKGVNEKIVIPNGIVSIGDFAFADCNLSGGIEVPDSLRSIGNYAFFHTTFYEPDFLANSKIESIGKYAFSYCFFPLHLEYYYNDGKREKDAHGNDIPIRDGSWNIILPESLCELGEYAFLNYGLSTTYKVIDNFDLFTSSGSMWASCLSLYTDQFDLIDLSKTKLLSIPKGAFQNTGYRYDGNCTIVLPETLKTIEEDAFLDNWAKYNTDVTWNIAFPSSLERIGKNAFGGGKRLDIVFEDNSCLTDIEENAFFNVCFHNEELVIPNSTTSIGRKAFYSNYHNYKVIMTLPQSLTTIGEDFCNKNNTELIVEEGSYADLYASENGYIILYDEDTSWLNN